jgi:uncharacterized damage-inducible protein DinB
VTTQIDWYRRSFEYEKDSHRTVLESLETTPPEGRESESYQKALNILGHVVAARRMWLHRLNPAIERPADLFPNRVTRDDLLAQIEIMERDWTDYLRTMSDADLERVITYQSVGDAGWFRSVVADVLTQLYGHSLYHRGQIASLVRAAGGQPAETDFIFWTREPTTAPDA